MSIHAIGNAFRTGNPASESQSTQAATRQIKLGDLPFADRHVAIHRSVDGTPVASPPASVRSTGDGSWEVRAADGTLYAVSADDEASTGGGSATAGPPTTNPPAVTGGPPTTNPPATAGGPPTTNPPSVAGGPPTTNPPATAGGPPTTNPPRVDAGPPTTNPNR